MNKDSWTRTVALGALFAALGVLCAWMAFDSLFALAAGMAAGSPRVVISSGSAAMAVGVPLMALFALMLAPWWSARARQRLFGAALVCLPLMLVAPAVFRTVMAGQLEARGYQRCLEPIVGSRGRTSAWVLNDMSLCEARPIEHL